MKSTGEVYDIEQERDKYKAQRDYLLEVLAKIAESAPDNYEAEIARDAIEEVEATE